MRENKNRWHQTNSQASGRLTLPPDLLSSHFPSSKGHPWDILWPAACQRPAGRLLPARSCPWRGPRMCSPALWCQPQNGNLMTLSRRGGWKTNGCCCLGVLEAQGERGDSWALLQVLTTLCNHYHYRENCPLIDGWVSLSPSWLGRKRLLPARNLKSLALMLPPWLKQPHYQDHTTQPWGAFNCCTI